VTQPIGPLTRPLLPAPGAPTPELRVARFRKHGAWLVWPAIVLVGVAGATGYFFDNLPWSWAENWMLFTAAAVAVVLLVILPFLAWWTHTYTITTRRVIERRGILISHRRELSHARGYHVALRRRILQRPWGTGTLTLSDGVEQPMRLVNVPSAELVNEVLVDQVEVSQMLAHRDDGELPGHHVPPMPPPPVPPAP
jgi:uncharacterized membrane protein YdbT with pleckstrin-like domain